MSASTVGLRWLRRRKFVRAALEHALEKQRLHERIFDTEKDETNAQRSFSIYLNARHALLKDGIKPPANLQEHAAKLVEITWPNP